MGTMEKMFSALGTVNRITVWFAPEQRESAREALEQVENYVNDMDDRLSVFKAQSEIAQINRQAGLCDTQVSRETFDLLKLSKIYGDRTGGAFDITTKPLTEATADKSADKVNYRDILLNQRQLTVKLRRQGQAVHLGGIAKGYALDHVGALLISYGIRHAVINLGGTVRHIGESRKTGIRHPFAAGEIAVLLDSSNEAVVTSGLYERGEHIFNPMTGQPARTDLISATVVGTNGTAADAAATACLVLDAQRSVALLASLGLEGVFIRRDGAIFATKGIQPRIQCVS